MRRFACVFALAFATSASAAELPTGAWAANLDGTKCELTISSVTGGKVSGSFNGTDFNGTWNGKVLAFTSDRAQYEAHLLAEDAEKGKVKYTLTGTRAVALNIPNRAAGAAHYAKVGWYAQLTADAPLIGEIRATVRGKLVIEEKAAYVVLKTTANAPEMRVWLRPAAGHWPGIRANLKTFGDREVVATGNLGQLAKADGPLPEGALYFATLPDIKLATKD